jgi:hypothetical protein
MGNITKHQHFSSFTKGWHLHDRQWKRLDVSPTLARSRESMTQRHHEPKSFPQFVFPRNRKIAKKKVHGPLQSPT